MARHRALQMFGRSGNPAFRSKAFTRRSSDFSTSEVMTLSGTVNKTGLYLLLCFMTAAWTWNQFYASGEPASIIPYLTFGVIGWIDCSFGNNFQANSCSYFCANICSFRRLRNWRDIGSL